MTWEYEGPIYIRPLGRGICLDSDTDDRYLDEALGAWLQEVGQVVSASSGWGGTVRLRVELVEEQPA